ncbi:alkaline phosphatase family protein [Arthrobacter sp. APC 3897]|uniref:alkaline phosphatase family protein n=1 Tax=Arthrobacter sp. APC 3897 TaxID=3035204 RepID=UPI0025B58BF3|nr:nucleotide pyrophosphatase/phosphodiesterase family protein [Arthrobacter sp. APC 3897]MDN3481333.1 alkaline phosphatase family protein [Arthrobacter sp. APC 3897]
MKPVLLLDIVGLTEQSLRDMPRLSKLAAAGWSSELATVLPAVTCTVQSTMLTGLPPSEHGIVGNGWYFRELGEVFLWRQHNKLVTGEKIWESARSKEPGYRAANICWWYAMGMSTDMTVTPRPIYHADGRKSPDAYIRPPALHDELVSRYGEFPLFQYWGPTAGIASTQWIAESTRHVMRTQAPELLMAYLPHLDYDLQRFGPNHPQAVKAAAELDSALAPLLDEAESRGYAVIAVSEYGIEEAHLPVDINRVLRREGLLEVYVQDGKEQLDTWASRAFAVADHQVAHVYIPDPGDVARTADILRGTRGIDEVMDRNAQARCGLDHQRSGELVVIAEPGAWFTYYFWLDDAHAPEYARGVDIHRKPGYDPSELFFNPADKLAKTKAGLNLIKKKAGLRYAMSTVPLDPRHVRGTHGRLPASRQSTPLVISSEDQLPPFVEELMRSGKPIPAAAVKSLVLQTQGLPE